LVQLGDEVEIMVLEIDEERRRISLGMKQCKPNPWDEFAATHNKGDKISGKIKSITDFGIFIGLDGGIDGLVHMSDISWADEGENSVRDFKKGDELETIILAVDSERERISLGIKQLAQDPFQNFLATHEKNSAVKGTVKEVDAKGATISLEDGVEGYLRATDIAKDLTLNEGDSVEAKFVGIDKKSKTISLSMRAKEENTRPEKEHTVSAKDYSASAQQNVASPTLGDIFKQQMEK